jgi:TPR repeat protein
MKTTREVLVYLGAFFFLLAAVPFGIVASNFVADTLKANSKMAAKEALLKPVKTKALDGVPEVLPDLERTCELSPGPACNILALMYEKGDVGIKDTRLARKLMQRACSALDREACGHLGRMHEEGIGGDVDMELADLYFKQACRLEEKDACQHVGRHLVNGTMVKQDYFVGFTLLSAACELGKEESCEAVKKIDDFPEIKKVIDDGMTFIKTRTTWKEQ